MNRTDIASLMGEEWLSREPGGVCGIHAKDGREGGREGGRGEGLMYTSHNPYHSTILASRKVKENTSKGMNNFTKE